MEHHSVAHDGYVGSLARNASASDWNQVLTFRYRPLNCPIGQFVFQNDHEVRITNCRSKQSLRAGRRPRCPPIQPSHVQKKGLYALGVIGPAPKAASIRRAYHHGTSPVSGSSIADFGGLTDQMIGGRMDKVGELDFGDRSKPSHCEADRYARDAQFGHRGIDDTLRTEPIEEAVSGTEHPAQPPNIFA